MLTQVTTRHGTYEINPPQDLIEYIPEFLSNREKDLLVLKSSVTKKDFSEIFRLGHRIKGVCQPFGFEVLGKIAEDFESAAHREDLNACDSLIKEFESVLTAVKVGFPDSKSEEQVSNVTLM